jgi:phage gp36-like protein
MYATPQDVLDRYSEDEIWSLVGDTPEGGLNLAALERALAEAGEEMNLSLRRRYSLPLATIPAILRRLCVDLALDTLPRNAAEEADMFERRAKEARRILGELAKGTMELGLPTIGGTEGSTASGPMYDTPPPHFGNLDGF